MKGCSCPSCIGGVAGMYDEWCGGQYTQTSPQEQRTISTVLSHASSSHPAHSRWLGFLRLRVIIYFEIIFITSAALPREAHLVPGPCLCGPLFLARFHHHQSHTPPWVLHAAGPRQPHQPQAPLCLAAAHTQHANTHPQPANILQTTDMCTLACTCVCMPR